MPIERAYSTSTHSTAKRSRSASGSPVRRLHTRRPNSRNHSAKAALSPKTVSGISQPNCATSTSIELAIHHVPAMK